MAMKLYINQTSPYARKVRVVVKEKRLDTRVKLFDVDPWKAPAALREISPLSRVPVLVTDESQVLTESDAISRYLDERFPAPLMLPQDFAERTEVVSRMGLLQGMIDSAFDAVIELRRPVAQQSAELIARQQRAVERGLDVVAAWPRPANRFDLGDVSLACLLGYLDFRHPAIAWRASWPAMESWFDAASQRPSMAGTAPDVPV